MGWSVQPESLPMTYSWTALLRQVERSAREVRVDERERSDLVQETLVRVWERVQAEGGGRPTSALVRTVLRRLKIDRWRRSRGVELQSLPEPRDAAPEPLQLIEDREVVGLLRQSVSDLPLNQREVVLMRMEEELPFREIAQRQGVPLGTALGRMHLAMIRLRRDLEAHA